MNESNNVRVDRFTQGPDGQEQQVDRLNVNSDNFLWIYVDSNAQPEGEYHRLVNGLPDQSTRVPLGAPQVRDGMYRFSVIHYVLEHGAEYLFRFADSLSMPTTEDTKEVHTLP